MVGVKGGDECGADHDDTHTGVDYASKGVEGRLEFGEARMDNGAFIDSRIKRYQWVAGEMLCSRSNTL